MGIACPRIWNVLHDAIVIGVSGEVPGDVVLTLECDYLRRRFTDPGNTFALTLNQCTRLVFHPWPSESAVVDTFNELAGLGLWILSAEQRRDFCEVHCARRDGSQDGGRLEVSAVGARLQLDTGRMIELKEIEAVAAAYWAEFSGVNRTM